MRYHKASMKEAIYKLLDLLTLGRGIKVNLSGEQVRVPEALPFPRRVHPRVQPNTRATSL